MPTFTDQIGQQLQITSKPEHIVSLVPSQTELLFNLGLASQVLGLTKFCIHPPEARKTSQIIGGTKKLHLDKIRALQPDLIIANKEENEKEQVEQLAKEFPVWTSDIANLEDALEMISAIGKLTRKSEEATTLVKEINNKFEQLTPTNNLKNALYLIWRHPYMAVGHDTFIHDMMIKAGFNNVLSDRQRYPMLTESEIVALAPQVVLLSSEPYPFAHKHIEEIQKIVPNSQVKLVDGELFSWYGSRLLKAPAYFQTLH